MVYVIALKINFQQIISSTWINPEMNQNMEKTVQWEQLFQQHIQQNIDQ